MRKGMMGLFSYAAHQEIQRIQHGPLLRAFLSGAGYEAPQGADPLIDSDDPLTDEALDEVIEAIRVQAQARDQWSSD